MHRYQQRDYLKRLDTAGESEFWTFWSNLKDSLQRDSVNICEEPLTLSKQFIACKEKMHLNNCERIFDKCWKEIILQWKQPKYIHRRILPTTFSKLSLLYTQFITLDCIYKKHMFKKKKSCCFHSGIILQGIQWTQPFLSIFPVSVPREVGFYRLSCVLITYHLPRFDAVLSLTGWRRKEPGNEDVLRFLFASKAQRKLPSDDEITWKASWPN